MNFFPRQKPYASIILCSGSLKSMKLNLYFSLKRASAFTESALTPTISTFNVSKCFFASRNSDASTVQPGVSAFG